MSKKTVYIHEAQDISGKNLYHWLELDMGNKVVNFRYEKFVPEETAERIYEILTTTNDDESWKELLDLMRPHFRDVVKEANEHLEADVMDSFGDRRFMVMKDEK